MTPYPLELRQRIVAAVDQQSHTIEEIATLFGVSERYVYQLLKLRRETGIWLHCRTAVEQTRNWMSPNCSSSLSWLPNFQTQLWKNCVSCCVAVAASV